MNYDPKPDDIRPIKPSKPVLDLSTGTVYMNGNSMKDLEMYAMDSIKSIEFEPESKNVFINLEAQPQILFKIEETKNKE